MKTEREIADFQAVMLDALYSCRDPGAALARLKADPKLAEFKDYLESFDADMFHLAADLVKQWGRKKQSAG